MIHKIALVINQQRWYVLLFYHINEIFLLLFQPSHSHRLFNFISEALVIFPSSFTPMPPLAACHNLLFHSLPQSVRSFASPSSSSSIASMLKSRRYCQPWVSLTVRKLTGKMKETPAWGELRLATWYLNSVRERSKRGVDSGEFWNICAALMCFRETQPVRKLN